MKRWQLLTVFGLIGCTLVQCKLTQAQDEAAHVDLRNEFVEDGAIPDEQSPKNRYLRDALKGTWVSPEYVFQDFDASGTTTWTHAHADQASCVNCHTTNPNQPNASRNDFWFYALEDHALESNQGMELGEVVIANLNDNFLRTHLKLKNRPALIVQKGNDAKQEDDEHSKEGEVTKLRAGDVILELNETPVEGVLALRQYVNQDRDGTLRLLGIREGEHIQVEVRAALLAAPEKPYRIGVQVEPPGDALRSQLRLYDNEGLLVTSIVEGSPAEDAGLKVHDILLRANTTRLSNFTQLRDTVQENGSEPMSLVVMRGGKEIDLTVTPTQDAETEVQVFCPAMTKAEVNTIWRQTQPATWLDSYFIPSDAPVEATDASDEPDDDSPEDQ